jgi:hypothetical protein
MLYLRQGKTIGKTSKARQGRPSKKIFLYRGCPQKNFSLSWLFTKKFFSIVAV